MQTVIVERVFEDKDAMQRCLEREAELKQPRGPGGVRCLVSCGARDGKHTVSMYQAENKEAVATALAELDLPYERLWLGQPVLEAASENASGFGTVVVQRLMPIQVTPQMAIQGFEAKKECYTLRQAGWDQTCIAEDGRIRSATEEQQPGRASHQERLQARAVASSAIVWPEVGGTSGLAPAAWIGSGRHVRTVGLEVSTDVNCRLSVSGRCRATGRGANRGPSARGRLQGLRSRCGRRQ